MRKANLHRYDTVLRRPPACILGLVLLVLLGVGGVNVFAQEGSWSQQYSYEPDSEPAVSLSAATITEILRREPGLLLAVKRRLVRQAFEQGRVLDPADLTDDALFRLLREDDEVRVLATEEIERREYVRAKPTRKELQQDEIKRVAPPASANASASAAAPAGQSRLRQNEEQIYWSEHEQIVPHSKTSAPPNPPAADGFSASGFIDPETPPPDESPMTPYQPPSQDYRRRQSMAGDEPQNRDFYPGVSPDAGPLPRTGPEAMPGLLSASMDQSAPAPRPGTMDTLPSSPYSSSPSASSPRTGANSAGQDFFASLPPFRLTGEAGWVPIDPRLDNRLPQPKAQVQMDEAQPMIRRRVNPYAGVPSLYDLYTQVSRRSPLPTRFGEDIFRNGTGNFDELPMDLPVGPDYVLGPGDGLSIELWGAVAQHLQRVVDREGRLALPEAGAVEVNGRSLGEVQQLVQNVLRSQFRDVHADVSLARLRTVRVYVVGDALRPGAYDVSSLSTPLNALYQAGGPTPRGSLRILRHYRGQQLIGEIDIYDLLLHGVRSSIERLQAGDTILVPPLGAEITVDGMVRRAAIYELRHESDLAEALELAGGVLNTGTLRHIEVERVVAHESRSMLRLDLPENNNQETVTAALQGFKIQDGDKIRISPLLPYSEQTVYLDGHVVHPGKHAYRPGMRVSDLLTSYADLLPEPAGRHAEIIRLAPPDYAPQVIAFNLTDALAAPPAGREAAALRPANTQNVTLQPFDTVRIFSRYDFEDPPTITVTGEVRHPGQHVTNGETRLRDAVYLAGGVTRNARLDDAQVFRRTADGKLKVLSVNLERALSGDSIDNVSLEAKDRVFIHRNLSQVDPATVTIEGEVARPGKYPLGEDMSAAQLVRLAGGLKRGAFTEAADLTRYTVENGSQVMGEHLTVPIARALAGDADTDMRLHDGDVLTIRQVAGWNDVGSTIALRGEVMHPGDYGIREGERISSVIARAGGLRSDAYLYAAILERRQVRELEEKNRSDLIRQVQGQEAAFKLIPDTGDAEEKLAKDATLQQWHATLAQLENLPPTGRLVVHLSKDIRQWANTPADLDLRAGDTLFIPKTPDYVLVNGQVYNPTAITFRPGKNAGWYLRQAGGPTNMAARKAVFVVRADGSVAGGKGSGEWFTGDVLNTELRPGDMVFVPEKALGGPPVWKNTLQAAQLLSSVAVAVSVGHGF
jgi:protein involved in polysaccharide export with SLBB domain